MNTTWKSVSPDAVRGFCGAQLSLLLVTFFPLRGSLPYGVQIWNSFQVELQHSSLNCATGCSSLFFGIMTASTFKRVLEAVFWFVVGHLSCAAIHHVGL